MGTEMRAPPLKNVTQSSRRGSKELAYDMLIYRPKHQNPLTKMCEELFEEPVSEPPQWSREALEHLSADLHRSKAEMSALLAEEANRPAFDPLKVRDMIREFSDDGHSPSALLLGQIESASFQHFVSRGFGEESGSNLKGKFFMGLLILEDPCPTRLEIIEDDDGGDHDGHTPQTPHIAA